MARQKQNQRKNKAAKAAKAVSAGSSATVQFNKHYSWKKQKVTNDKCPELFERGVKKVKLISNLGIEEIKQLLSVGAISLQEIADSVFYSMAAAPTDSRRNAMDRILNGGDEGLNEILNSKQQETST